MAYLYIHTRLDKNEIFYVGIGKDTNGKYTRAFSKKRRNSFWKYIVNKSEYKVDIIYDNVTWDEACQKEINFIKHYGRRDLKLGTLVNLTNGGDGVNGYTHSLEQLLKISKKSKGSNNGNAKCCVHFDSGLRFGNLKEACVYFNLKYGSQASAIRNKQSTAQFYFENEYFERPTREQISKKLGTLRIGNQNWRGKL